MGIAFLKTLVGRPAPDPARDPAPDPAPLAETVPPTLSKGRRDRTLPDGGRVLLDGLSGKVLHAWLQNRHQTLFPLAINFGSLAPDHAAAVARWMAVVALATHPVPEASRVQAASRDWLASMGASQATQDTFDATMADPPPLHHAMAAVSNNGLMGYAYVVALIATDAREPGTQPFLDFVAVRLELPATMIRSATRRYRR